MNIISSYKVKIKHYNNIFNQTVSLYRQAVSFFIEVCDEEWATLSELKGNDRFNKMEALILTTKKNPSPKYPFNSRFYKMPCYLRRAAIQEALGCYSSYNSNLKNWEAKPEGKAPTLTLDRNVMPTLYKPNTFKRITRNHVEIKIYHKNDWVWLPVQLREQDIRYIERHCHYMKELSPTLTRRGKQWYLTFPFEHKTELHIEDIHSQLIVSVDLGINNNATCSALLSDGTVVARTFINLATEKDHLYKAVNRVKRAQQAGSHRIPTKWKHVNDLNTDISRKTAAAILTFALSVGADTIVFEHLSFTGKKRGSKKQRLHLWRKKEIQRIVTHRAHLNGLRISRVCAWNTSRLAYDGTGRVTRGKYLANGIEKYNYSICTFTTGKQYNCDLNATYNIGARYFIREILKSTTEMWGLPTEANVLQYGTGTTRTLSTLIKLNADLCGLPKVA